jgi:histidyl-tRNA synthetase
MRKSIFSCVTLNFCYNTSMALQTQSYKGARDFYPADMRVQNYIFDTWKRVCKSFGFVQYDFPILEPFEIFAAKSGEELVNEQLFSFEDRGGRKLAIRPELTPGTVRLIAQKYKELPRPIKWFMIGNNWRYEKPQMGRGREFYQLEANIFGVEGVEADFEIFSLIINIMQAFGATEEMYEIRVSDRRLISELLTNVLGNSKELQSKVRRLMDKRLKMEKEDFLDALADLGLNPEQSNSIEKFMFSSLETLELSQENEGYLNLTALFRMLERSGLKKYVRFDPSIIRGFDYSDGLVYEVFDKNPTNRRSMFGGERFDKLINIFGNFDLPATGFAMGDYTLKEFLKGWNLLPEETSEIDYLVAVWPSDKQEYLKVSAELADFLRKQGKNVFLWTQNSKLEKQLKYADNQKIKRALIIGDEELKNKTVTVKNMENGVQETIPLEKFFSTLE